MSGPLLFANVARTTLAGAITSIATTAQLASGSGALFPAPSGGQYFKMTFNDAATGLLREIVHVTNVTTDTITMIRAQEGTTAQNWSAGDLATNKLTAGSMADMTQDAALVGALGAYAVDSGTANAIQIVLSPSPGSYLALQGAPLRIQKVSATNTGAVTIESNGILPAQALVRPNGTQLQGGELPGNAILTVVYDGTNFELQSVSNAGPRVFNFAGTNPNGSVAGQAASGNIPPDFCWAEGNDTLWTCTVTGNAAAAQWSAPGTPGGGGALAGPGASVDLSAILTSAGPAITFTANALTVVTTLGGQGFTLPSFSQVINTGATGPGGMDVGFPPISSFLSIYAIYNPQSGARAVLGTIECQTPYYTGSNMPAGYTASSLISIWPTDGSRNFMAGYVVDRDFYYTLGQQVLVGGVSMSVTAVNMTAAVPAVARVAHVFAGAEETSSVTGNSFVEFLPTTAFGLIGFVQITTPTLNFAINMPFDLPMLTSQFMYYYSQNGTCAAKANVNGYRI